MARTLLWQYICLSLCLSVCLLHSCSFSLYACVLDLFVCVAIVLYYDCMHAERDRQTDRQTTER